MSKKLIYTALTGLLICAPSYAMADDNEVVVGIAASESGWQNAYAGPATKAALIAIDRINEKGGLLGKKLRAEIWDSKSDKVQGAKAAEDVLDKGAAVVIVDSDYDLGAPAALVAERAGIISIFPAAESVLAGIQGVGKHSFGASVLAATTGATIAEWGVDKKGWKTAYLLQDDSIQYSKSVCYGFDWGFREKGGEIVGHDIFLNNDASIQSQIDRLKALPTKPDVIALCSYNPGQATAVRQIRAAGIDTPIAAGSSASGADWLSSTPNLSEFYMVEQGSVYGDDPRPEIKAFNAEFEKRNGEAPVSHFVYLGYVSVEMWAKAVEKAGTFDSDAVVAALETFKDEPVLVGTRTFTSELHHQARAPFLVTGITAGKPQVVGEYTVSDPVPMDVHLGKTYKY